MATHKAGSKTTALPFVDLGLKVAGPVAEKAGGQLAKLLPREHGTLVDATASAVIALHTDEKGAFSRGAGWFRNKEPTKNTIRKALRRHVQPFAEVSAAPDSASLPDLDKPAADTPARLWLTTVLAGTAADDDDCRTLKKVGMPPACGENHHNEPDAAWKSWCEKVLIRMLDTIDSSPDFVGLQRRLFFQEERSDADAARALQADVARSQGQLALSMRAISSALTVLASASVGLLLLELVGGHLRRPVGMAGAALTFALLAGVPLARLSRSLLDERSLRRITRRLYAELRARDLISRSWFSGDETITTEEARHVGDNSVGDPNGQGPDPSETEM